MNKRNRLSLYVLCLILLLQSVGFYCAPVAASAKSIQPQIGIGNGFMVALTAQGKLYTWGNNSAGTLGNGTQTDTNYATPVSAPASVTFSSISVGNNHVLALATDGSVYAWGSNNYGQLGNTQTTHQTTPKLIEALPHDEGIYAVAVAAGNAFSLALMNNGTVWGWGLNNKCQLGSVKESSEIPTQISIVDAQSSNVFITQIYAGDTSAAAITVSGSVYFWGDNSEGQLGSANFGFSEVFLHTSLSSCNEISFGKAHSVALLSNGTLKNAGKNDKKQFGHATEDESFAMFLAAEFSSPINITKISAGPQYTVALTNDGSVFTWGYNPKGALGFQAVMQINNPQEVNLQDATAVDVCAYQDNVAVITDEGLVYTWGANTTGQLGNHTKVGSTAPVAVCLSTGATDILNLGQGSSVITQSTYISVQANIPAPTYTVTIPSTIPVGMLEQMVQQDDGSHVSQTAFSVGINNVDNLFNEKKIVVTLSSGDSTGRFVLRDVNNETYLLAYTVMTDYGTTHEINSGDVYAEFTASGNVTGKILLDRTQITRDGSYAGTVTFAVSVVDIEEQN